MADIQPDGKRSALETTMIITAHAAKPLYEAGSVPSAPKDKYANHERVTVVLRRRWDGSVQRIYRKRSNTGRVEDFKPLTEKQIAGCAQKVDTVRDVEVNGTSFLKEDDRHLHNEEGIGYDIGDTEELGAALDEGWDRFVDSA